MLCALNTASAVMSGASLLRVVCLADMRMLERILLRRFRKAAETAVALSAIDTECSLDKLFALFMLLMLLELLAVLSDMLAVFPTAGFPGSIAAMSLANFCILVSMDSWDETPYSAFMSNFSRTSHFP